MSSKSKKAPKKLKAVVAEAAEAAVDPKLAAVKGEAIVTRNAFMLISNASHPGKQADTVMSVLGWLDRKNLAAVEEWRKLEPEAFEEPKTGDKVEAPAAEPAV